MAITIISQPELLALSKNPIEFTLETDNRSLMGGTNAVMGIGLTGYPTAEQSFTLSWTGNSETFTFKASPDSSGNQLSSSFIGIALFIARLVDELSANYALNRDFVITQSTYYDGYFTYYRVVLTARNPGTAYSLTLTESLTYINEQLNTPGTDEDLRPNFKMLMAVYVYDAAGLPELVYEELQEPDSNDRCIFDISGVLDPYVMPESPEMVVTDIETAALPSRKYFIRYAESFGSPPVVQVLTRSSDFYVLNGGLRKQDFPSIDFMEDIVVSRQRFLTWQPRTKTVTKEQKEFLYYFRYRNSTSVTLRVDITYTDGTTLGHNAFTLDPSAQYDMLIVPAGYNDLQLDSVATKPVKQYAVYLTSNLGVDSELFTYVIETECRLPERYFLFANSLGGMDTLRTYGDHTSDFEADFDLSGKTLASGYAAKDGELIKTSITSQDGFMVSTGFVEKQYKEYLTKELLLSEEVYEISGDNLIPIIISSKKEDLYKESDNLYALRFEYSISYKNQTYSKPL